MSVRVESPHCGGTERWEYGVAEHRKVEALKQYAKVAVEVHDRYCQDDPEVDTFDIGKALEDVRGALQRLESAE